MHPTTPPPSRIVSCSCGQLQAQVSGEPVRVSVCHCLACQRRTGSVFGAQARFPREAVTVVGTSAEYVRVGDEGTKATFRFCPKCGGLRGTHALMGQHAQWHRAHGMRPEAPFNPSIERTSKSSIRELLHAAHVER